MKFSVLAYNFNNYEKFRELPDSALSNNIDYIYVTDNPNIKSNRWRVIVDKSLDGLGKFDKCYRVRFGLFNYTDADICVYIDGSIRVHQPITPMVSRFIHSGKDMAVMVHPEQSTMFDEYMRWVEIRNYPKAQAFKCLGAMQMSGYDVMNYHGLYQGGMRIVKNLDKCRKVDEKTLELLTKLGDATDVERIDQTVWSYVLNHLYTDVTLYPFTQSWIQSTALTIHGHNSDVLCGYHPNNTNPMGFVRNKSVLVDIEPNHQ